MKTLLITGVGGLIGSACAKHFHHRGWKIVGVDCDARKEFFGASVLPNLATLGSLANFELHGFDLVIPELVSWLVSHSKPDAVIHAAAQPSHDWAKNNPTRDWQINAGVTQSLLDACRIYAPQSPFVFLSTNKVYGDNPNRLAVRETPTRYEYVSSLGIDETCSVDQCTHSLFGASKLAADVLTQEYGRYFGMPTICLRAGCLTGEAHCGAELHGFLSYLVNCNLNNKTYRIIGHNGKQVRDNLHADDIALFCEKFFADPCCGEVFNIGGGRNNSISVLEAIRAIENLTGMKMKIDFVETPRTGDHVCYISKMDKINRRYGWEPTIGLPEIFSRMIH